MRQPLQSLALTARILTLDCTDAERRAAVQSLRLVLASLDEMVVVLTEMARLANGSQVPRLGRTMLSDVVEAVIADVGPAATAAGITLEHVARAAEVRTDSRLLAMVIKGLVLFAVKEGTGDRIVIETRLAGAGRHGAKVGLDIGYTGPSPGSALYKQALIELFPLDTQPPRPVQGIGLAFVVVLVDRLKIAFDHGRGRGSKRRLSLHF